MKTDEVILLYLSIDRIENGIAVCVASDGSVAEIPVDSIYGEVREGSVIVCGSHGDYSVDTTEEERLRNENFELAESLFDE